MNKNDFLNNNCNSFYNNCNGCPGSCYPFNCYKEKCNCSQVCPQGPIGPAGPAGNVTALTITPLAGGTRPVSAHLVILGIE